jgi:hypothetical protein
MGRAAESSKATLNWLLAALVALPWSVPTWAQGDAQQPTFKAEQIDQVVAPIALYPDSLLAQVLMASTYPLEIVEAARWQKSNASLKDKALDEALQQQTWDPSVKSLVSFPQVLTMMNDKLDWTQQLGDAFLAQQADVMDAVQRLRSKAQAQGNLQTTEQQKVVVQQPPADAPAGSPPVIVIQPANPQVVYVPTYNPTVVYGSWPYPSYPPYSYYPPGYVAGASLLSFGAGMAVGSALWGNTNWGWGHGHGDVNVNYNNYQTFNNNVTNSVNRANLQNKYQNGNWQHDPSHRKGAQYRDKATQQRFNKEGRPGADSREAFRGRAEQGRQQIAREGAGNVQRDLANRGGVGNTAGGGAGNKLGGGQQRPGGGGNRVASAQRPGGGGSLGGGAGNKAGGGAGNRGGASRGQGSGAFKGVGDGGQVRRDSARGNASRQSAANFGSHGGGGHGGGGGRGGGGGGGGGGRGGGGGGRRR